MSAQTANGRPRAAHVAHRMTDASDDGWLWDDQFWSLKEWEQRERRRQTWRDYRARQRSMTYTLHDLACTNDPCSCERVLTVERRARATSVVRNGYTSIVGVATQRDSIAQRRSSGLLPRVAPHVIPGVDG